MLMDMMDDSHIIERDSLDLYTNCSMCAA